MGYVGRRFGLSAVPGVGVTCNDDGLFVGAVPLLERNRGEDTADQWQPRPLSGINLDLSKRYGLPVEFDRKAGGLQAIARALSRGDLVHAQIAALHLEIPDPPPLAKSQSIGDIIDLARQLRASGLLKEDWDPAKHPRWPAGSPDSIGGRFAPAGIATDDVTVGAPTVPVIPAQITIPAPFELPGGIPFPSEIVPPPVIPNINPRAVPRNPYPDRPDCVKEWATAERYCRELLESGRLGKGDYREHGKFLYQCIMGQVSEACGGNATGV